MTSPDSHRWLGRKVFLRLIIGISAAVLLVLGIMASRGWLPEAEPLTGRKRGWFGRDLPAETSSVWNPFAGPLPTPTPQLSKEYIYAGSRLLAVEDAAANAAIPSDLAVWRPSSGVWWVLGGASGQPAYVGEWGINGDVPVPGDFDGDGRTDFAVWRPSEGIWYIVRSSDSAVQYVYWGTQGDTPIAADFDGDGHSDPGIVRNSSGTLWWYIRRSSDGQAAIFSFGIAGDIPAAADYDGDGRADVGVFRPSNQTFYSTDSASGQTRIAPIGQSGTKVSSCDFDGDGRADQALFDSASAVWHILQSTNGQIINATWGAPGDIAVQNDYDADGRCDLATWRPSNGTWYIRQSSKTGITGQQPTSNNPYPNELRQTQWGQNGDIPVPAFYRR